MLFFLSYITLNLLVWEILPTLPVDHKTMVSVAQNNTIHSLSANFLEPNYTNKINITLVSQCVLGSFGFFLRVASLRQ